MIIVRKTIYVAYGLLVLILSQSAMASGSLAFIFNDIPLNSTELVVVADVGVQVPRLEAATVPLVHHL